MTHAALVAAGAVIRAAADSSVSPGVLGFIVVALLGVATWLLIRSMNRQIRKIDIPEDDDAARPDDDAERPDDDDARPDDDAADRGDQRGGSADR